MIFWATQHAGTPDVAGGTRHLELSRHLQALGEDVTVLASDFSLTARRYTHRRNGWDRRTVVADVDGVRFEWLHATPYSGNDWRRVLNMLSFAWSLFVRLARASTDQRTVFIGSSPPPFTALAACLAARLRRVPFVLEVRDLWPETLVDMTGRRGWLSRVLEGVAEYLYRSSQVIVVLAKGNRERIAARGHDPRKIYYVPNGVDLERFEQVGGCPIDMPTEASTFVYTGAHGPANGLDVVVRAAAVLEDRGHEDIRVLLIGDGPTKQDLIALRDRLGATAVSFHDPIAKRDIPAVLARATGGLHVLRDVPVFRDGISPNKLFDYMAAGLPVLTNVNGEVATIVEQAGCGIRVAAESPEALAQGMIDLRDARRADPRFGTGGRAYIATHHERSQVAKEMRDVLHTLTK